MLLPPSGCPSSPGPTHFIVTNTAPAATTSTPAAIAHFRQGPPALMVARDGSPTTPRRCAAGAMGLVIAVNLAGADDTGATGATSATATGATVSPDTGGEVGVCIEVTGRTASCRAGGTDTSGRAATAIGTVGTGGALGTGGASVRIGGAGGVSADTSTAVGRAVSPNFAPQPRQKRAPCSIGFPH